MFGFGKRQLAVTCQTASETGLVRKDNQDSVFVNAEKSLFCVADGMGGGSEGATASRFVCEALDKADVKKADSFAAWMKRVDAAIAEANGRILAYAKERNFKQMGSTVALLMVDPEDSRKAAICHVGDSRIYRVRRGIADLLTRDHTIGGQLSELAGGARAADLRSRANPLAHVLTRAIGVEPTVATDWRKIDIADDDAFLICSDGVHDVTADSQIGEILTMAKSLPAASKRLAKEIVRCGAPDNYSYVMVRFGGAR